MKSFSRRRFPFTDGKAIKAAIWEIVIVISSAIVTNTESTFGWVWWVRRMQGNPF